MLISQKDARKVPFLLGTLLEMTIDTDGELFHRPIKALGKVIRYFDRDSTLPKYAICISQMTENQEMEWHKAISVLDQEDPVLAS